MGSATSKQQGRLSLDSGDYSQITYQNKSISSDAFHGERARVIKRSRSCGGFVSTKDAPKRKTLPCKPEMIKEINTCEQTEALDDFTLINTWELVDPSESMFTYLEPKVSSPSQKASDEILPQLNSNDMIETSPLSSKCCVSFNLLGIVRARVNSFERKIDARRWKLESGSFKNPLAEKKKVVFYFTSLTGIPSTHEDCQDAKAILQGYGVCLDERDVSTDAKFKEELNELLGTSFSGKLPRIFVDRCHIGGVEELWELHMRGELIYLLNRCEMKAIGNDGDFELCPGCTGTRYLPCLNCSGSCRVYLDSKDGDESNSVQFQRCKDCNDNGLVRCPLCCEC